MIIRRIGTPLMFAPVVKGWFLNKIYIHFVYIIDQENKIERTFSSKNKKHCKETSKNFKEAFKFNNMLLYINNRIEQQVIPTYPKYLEKFELL
jgi:hypothetical protein